MDNKSNKPKSNAAFSACFKDERIRLIQGKKYRVLYQEELIHSTIDEVWNEVSGNFMNGGALARSINVSYCLSGELTQGLGAERYLNLNFQGKPMEVKERIVEFKEEENFREFTYHVYESEGSLIKMDTYFTWLARRTRIGNKTVLGTKMIFRAKLGLLNGIVTKKIIQSGTLRTGILVYKHYLETGEKKIDSKKLNQLYP